MSITLPEVVSGNSTLLLEAVNHPVHYGGEGNLYETIVVLSEWLTPEQLEGFCLGNAIKYLSRAGKKGDKVEDWKKAGWYLDWIIKRMEGRKHERNSSDF